jgi:hypothetical protein
MPGCILTQGYNLDCRDSFGGLSTVYVMELANATTITQTAGIVTAITKASTKKFFEYKLVAFTGDADDNMTASRENGTVFTTQGLRFPINKMTVAVRNELLLLAQNRLVIVIVDQNGLGWMYGKINGMMITSIGAKTGKALGDRNGYELVFEGMEKELAPNVNDATILALTTAGV